MEKGKLRPDGPKIAHGEVPLRYTTGMIRKHLRVRWRDGIPYKTSNPI